MVKITSKEGLCYTYQELHPLGQEHTRTDHIRLISNLKLL